MLVGLAVFVLAPVHVQAQEPSADSDRALEKHFEETVKPFLAKHCSACHGSKKQEADLRLDQLSSRINSETADHWNLVRLQLRLQQMPPEDRPQPSAREHALVVEWLTQSLRRAKVQLLEPDEAYLPKFGNRVDHELLFDGSIKLMPATEARLWRISPQAYDSLVKGELAKNAKGIAQPFGGLAGGGFQDYSDAFSIDEPTAGQLMRNATSIVASQMRGSLVDGKWVAKGYPQPVKEFVSLLEDKNHPLTDELKNKALRKQFQLVLRRDPSEQELDRFRGLLETSTESVGLERALRTTLTAVLLTPEAVFRFELGDGEPDDHGRTRLSPREIAYAISYAVSDRPPSTELLRAAAEGKLDDREGVAEQVTILLDHPKVTKSRIPRFFREFFGYHRAGEVFKDKSLNPYHRADVLVSDTDQLIAWILERDENVLYELLTTERSFVNYNIDKNRGTISPRQAKELIHTSYGLPADWKWTPKQPVSLPKGERAGILTQPSWLVANSGNFDNHPIHRGKWIREKLLCGWIPDLPITVDAQLPEEPEHTLRHRMRVTREAYCWNCHKQMNPLGLAFEAYDHFGRYRTTEKIVDPVATEKNVDSKGKSLGQVLVPVAADASCQIEGSGDGKLDGQYDDAVAMIHQLARSERVRQNFVRHCFRYWMGRNEQLRDSATLIEADQAYVKQSGSFRALLISLLTSDSFLYRTATQ